jgi:retron-type reverse transcriptase
VRKRINYVVDADIKGFFDHMSHDWTLKFVEYYIKDPNILWLINKYLKAGVLEDGTYQTIESGSAQGGLCRARHKFPYTEINVMPS